MSLVVFLAIGLLPLSAKAGGGAFDRAIKLERAGRLGAALVVLQPLPLSGAQATHRAALARAIAAIAAARVYESRHQLDTAESVLANTAKTLDPVRDVYVRSIVEENVAVVEKAVATPVASGLLPDLWRGVKDAGRTVLKWLIVVVGLLVIVAAVRIAGRLLRSLRPPRKGIGLALDDMSVDSDKRTQAGRALGRELSVAIASASQGAAEEPRSEIDLAKDLDGGVSLNVRVVGDALAGLDPYLDDGSPVKIGPVSVSPRQLFEFLGSAFRARYEYEVRGYYAVSGTTSRVVMELHRDQFATVRWSCKGDGDGGRAGVVLEAARRILFETAVNNSMSMSWPSVAAYREARARLAGTDTAGDRPTALEDVRRLLERSLAQDPANTLARIELGTVLRKLGRNADAIAQYDFVQALSTTEAASPPASLSRALDYSRAVALSKIPRWDEHKRSLELLVRLHGDIEADQKLDDVERERLLLLVTSAWAATKVFEVEQFRSQHEPAKTRAQSGMVLNDLRDARDWIVAARDRRPNVDLSAYVQATAIAENAFGRAAYLNDRPTNEVISAFEHALSLTPELGDAHVNMASALLRARSRYSDWMERVEHHLERALEISPRDRKALYLRGQFYLHGGRPEEARKAFEDAAEAGDEWASLRLGELEWEAGKKKEAVALARRSLVRGPASDARARLLVTWTAELAKKGIVDRETPLAAHRAGTDLERTAKKRRRELGPGLARAIALIDGKLARKRPSRGVNEDLDDHDHGDD